MEIQKYKKWLAEYAKESFISKPVFLNARIKEMKKKCCKPSLKYIPHYSFTRLFITLSIFHLFLFAEFKESIGQQPESRNDLDAFQEYTRLANAFGCQGGGQQKYR